jgi:cytidine deaminase
MTDHDLVAAAWRAREWASAPYSHYRVGAALLSASGNVFLGANVESSSYGLSVCAERIALFKALTDGDHGPFLQIAVVAEGRFAPSPCGACRQLLADYALGVEVLLSNVPDEFERISLAEIFPRPFSSEFLK